MSLLCTADSDVDFVHWLQTQGPTVVFLAIGIYIVGRALMSAQAKLDTEKNTRLDEHKQRITSLEEEKDKINSRLDSCENDRAELRVQVTHLQRRSSSTTNSQH